MLHRTRLIEEESRHCDEADDEENEADYRLLKADYLLCLLVGTYDHQPVALFDEPALVRVPRTAHVLPAAPLAYNPCPCTLRHPRGLVSPGSRTGPSGMLSRRPPLPWQVRVGDPQAASAALSDAIHSDAALPDAAACCDAPLPLPGHSPARGPRPPVRGHHCPYGHRLL